MSLLPSSRHTSSDLERWATLERYDRTLGAGSRMRRRAEAARDELIGFVEAGPCYCGVSWGKDSVVVAHLVQLVAPHVPLCWVRVEGKSNPDCPAVRDAFLAMHPGAIYDEIEAPRPERGLTSSAGFAVADARHGDRYISGVRAEESSTRTLRTRRWGCSTKRTCAPIAWWTHQEVFAYLAHHGLPVHPAYAMTYGGALDRSEVRVAAIGGLRGRGRGRAEWEAHYYPEVFEYADEG